MAHLPANRCHTSGRPTLVDALALGDAPADWTPAAGADAGEPEDPRAPTSPPLRQMLAWAIEELAQAQYALRMQRPPPPDPQAGWEHFTAGRLEWDEAAAVEAVVPAAPITFLKFQEGPPALRLRAAGDRGATGPPGRVSGRSLAIRRAR